MDESDNVLEEIRTLWHAALGVYGSGRATDASLEMIHGAATEFGGVKQF